VGKDLLIKADPSSVTFGNASWKQQRAITLQYIAQDDEPEFGTVKHRLEHVVRSAKDEQYNTKGNGVLPMELLATRTKTGWLSDTEIAGLSVGIVAFLMLVALVVRHIHRSSNAKVTQADLKASAAVNEKDAAKASMKRVEREKAVLQDKLHAAQKLVKQVMAEGGALLDTYHLDYSDIDFGGEDVEERIKLGEGAQALTLLAPSIASLPH
jgi:hypothetical protein